MRLLIATSNSGKLREIKQLLSSSGLDVIGLEQLSDPPMVLEDGSTFEENAVNKAVTLARFSGYPTLADDSGLCVDALNGAPGIYSARYAGSDADDAANNARLIRELAGLERAGRRAHFHCSIALAWPDGRFQTVNGRVDGFILDEPRGTEGFGYDPLFLVPEYGKTMAELSASVKNRISHRGQALHRILPLLQNI